MATETDILQGLDPEQREIVLHDKGPCLVAAVAGCGKTLAVVRRMAYLASVRGVDPARIFGLTFSKKAAEEMTERAQKLSPGVRVQTFHAFCRAVLAEEMPDFARWTLDDKDHYRTLVKKAVGYEHMDWVGVDLEKVVSTIGLAKASGVHPFDPANTRDTISEQMAEHDSFAIAMKEFSFDVRITQAFEITEQLRLEAREHTFDDWLILVHELFRDNDYIRRKWASKFDYVLVDEAQDNSMVQAWIVEALARDHRNIMAIGDVGQCVAYGSMIDTLNGPKPVQDIERGERVLSYRNGAVVPSRVSRCVDTGNKECVALTTESGRRITMSIDHKIWASIPTPDSMLVYLMYRRDMGFRIGITNKGLDSRRSGDDERTDHPIRFGQESADRLWVLSVEKDREEAIFKEISYILRYAVPQYVFEAQSRGINQARVDAVFREFGRNGQKILDTLGLKFEFPHWTSSSSSSCERPRRVVRVVAHGVQNTNVTLEWTGDDVDVSGIESDVQKAKKGGSRIRKWFASYAQGRQYAENLLRRIPGEATIRETLVAGDKRLVLMNAAAVYANTFIAERTSDGTLVSTKVVSVERVGQMECFDLEIEDTGNFFTDSILSHNSIYAFRGAAPKHFVSFKDVWSDARVISMNRNYRCADSVIALANRSLLTMASDTRIGDLLVGTRNVPGTVFATGYDTQEDEADGVASQIKALHDDGVPWSDCVVLYRTNALSRAIESALISQKIPHHIIGSTCFYLRREIASLVSYLRVAGRLGSKMKDLERTLFAPHRYLGKKFLACAEQAIAEKPPSFAALMDRACAGMAKLTKGQRNAAEEWGRLMDELRFRITARDNGLVEDGNPGSLLQTVVDRTRFTSWLIEDEGRETPDNDRVSNVAELIRAAGQFKTTSEFVDHVNQQIAAAKMSREIETHNSVTLMSCHRSKALEWPYVFLISCNEGVLPHRRAEDPEEEKRIFYVAVTRAREELRMSWVKTTERNGRLILQKRSQFIPESYVRDAAVRVAEPEEERLEGGTLN